jgi:hypothetical protein
MSETRYVNRIDQSQFKHLDPSHVDSLDRFPKDEPLLSDTVRKQFEATQELTKKLVDQSAKDLGWNLPAVEDSDSPIEEPGDSIGNTLNDVRGILSDVRLDKFKQQVIAAFKHLGLPVSKFFPE